LKKRPVGKKERGKSWEKPALTRFVCSSSFFSELRPFFLSCFTRFCILPSRTFLIGRFDATREIAPRGFADRGGIDMVSTPRRHRKLPRFDIIPSRYLRRVIEAGE